ncbi:MAG: bifunctional phosphoribosylaminoimidazolecarboxamide formyltransferase/IMP cyclohydrolase [Solirubrobacteraceae bacterium]
MLARIADAADIESTAGLTAPPASKVRRALLSVSDKRGIVDFARGLADLGVQLVSTGGTASALTDAGLDVRSIEDFTGFPEIMDGRVKTLHPRLYAGLLAVRSNPAHVAALAEHDIEEVDLVCVNLYPFESTAARRDVGEAEIVENIDIGGPTMIRAAAKNHADAAVVTSPESYDAVLDELRESGGELSQPTRASLAAEAFAYTARYDTAIAGWFEEGSEDLPQMQAHAYEKVADLRYGENPHQRAAYYAQVGAREHLLSDVAQLHGKQLSFNNLLDFDAVRTIVRDFDDPACVIVKHNNPCGAALGDDPLQAYQRAFATDPLSAFGGVIAFNRTVDKPTAEALSEQFVEVLLAPGYDEDALKVLMDKPSIRIMRGAAKRAAATTEPDVKHVLGGLLVQDHDVELGDRTEMEIATQRAPTDDEWRDLLFAWQVCKHVRSNAIVLARDRATAGIGAGQMSRVDSVRLAVNKSRLDSLQGAVLASDAFFPFSDGPEIAIGAGVTAIIQPGGSRNDPQVREAADEAGIAMVFTSRRHFRH